MSYQYPYIEHYSPSPVSTTPQAFAQWEVTDDPLVVSPQHVEQQPTPESDQNQTSATTPTSYEVPKVIQLTERPQHRNQTSVQALAQNQNQSQQVQSTPRISKKVVTHTLTPQALTPLPGRLIDLHHIKTSASTVSNGDRGRVADLTAPVRHALANRAQARLASHPYHRRAISGDVRARRDAESALHTGMSITTSATVMACGGPNEMTRCADLSGNFTLTTLFSNEINSSPSPTEKQKLPVGIRRLLIRTDIHYSAETNTVTAMLELPGVKKSSLRLNLHTCPYSRVRQISVSGKAVPVFSEEGFTVRERKFGEFMRTLVVPPETKVNGLLNACISSKRFS